MLSKQLPLRGIHGPVLPVQRPARRLHQPICAKEKNVNVVTPGGKWQTKNGLIVPITYPQLMGLRGRSLYLEAQITGAYDEQLARPLEEGYSDVARRGREQLLLYARDGMRSARGRVSNMTLETTIDPILLPGAMALLEQGGFYDMVLQLSQQSALLDERDLRASNKDTVHNFYRDVALATALAHCGLAHQALKKGHIALGCGRLEEALQILKDGSAGSMLRGQLSNPLAPELQRRIESALVDFKADAILNYLKGPLHLSTAGASLRPQAVAALSVMLARPEEATRSDGSQPLTPEYVAAALDAMASEEICDLMDWDKVAHHKSHYCWYFAGVLPVVALAHIVCGFVHRKPSHITTAYELLESAGTEADVAVQRAVCALLLGSTQEAVEILKEDDRLGRIFRGEAPEHETAPGEGGDAAAAASGIKPKPRGPVSFPSRDGILEFVRMYSPEGDHDLTPGLCIFAEAWLVRLAFTRFRDTKERPPSASIAAYLDDPRVMAGIARQAAAGVALAKLRLPSVRYIGAGVAALLAASLLLRGIGGRLSGGGSGTRVTSVKAVVKPAEAAVGAKISTLTVPGDVELTRDVVRHIVEQWLRIKAEAMGPRHKTNQLSTVLAEPMLSAVKDESEDAAESGWFWNIHPLKVKIERVDTSKLTTKGGQATALAVVEEAADLWASNGRKGDSYKTSYKVEYNIVKDKGKWKISSALVLGR